MARGRGVQHFRAGGEHFDKNIWRVALNSGFWKCLKYTCPIALIIM